MNYAKIQEILEHDTKFYPIVSVRDAKVNVRGSDVAYSSLTVQVAAKMQEMKCDERSCPRHIVLAVAARITSGSVSATPPPVAQNSVAKVDAAEVVVVKSVPTPGLAATPARIAAKSQQEQFTQFVDRNDIVKLQSTVAISQLLAAIAQLAETDTWPGHEERKEQLAKLLTTYEAVSRAHINLSVKQIISSGKTEVKTVTG